MRAFGSPLGGRLARSPRPADAGSASRFASRFRGSVGFGRRLLAQPASRLRPTTSMATRVISRNQDPRVLLVKLRTITYCPLPLGRPTPPHRQAVPCSTPELVSRPTPGIAVVYHNTLPALRRQVTVPGFSRFGIAATGVAQCLSAQVRPCYIHRPAQRASQSNHISTIHPPTVAPAVAGSSRRHIEAMSATSANPYQNLYWCVANASTSLTGRNGPTAWKPKSAPKALKIPTANSPKETKSRRVVAFRCSGLEQSPSGPHATDVAKRNMNTETGTVTYLPLPLGRPTRPHRHAVPCSTPELVSRPTRGIAALYHSTFPASR